MLKVVKEIIEKRAKEQSRPLKGYRITCKDVVVVAENNNGEKICWIPKGVNQEGETVDGFWYHLDGTNRLSKEEISRFQHWFHEN